jgi:hypothetical protein
MPPLTSIDGESQKRTQRLKVDPGKYHPFLSSNFSPVKSFDHLTKSLFLARLRKQSLAGCGKTLVLSPYLE